MTIQLSTRTTSRPTTMRPPRVLSETIGLSGLRASAKVATPKGWRMVRELRVGDQVQTLDGGIDHIVKIDQFALNHRDHVARPATWHMFFPAGAIGNVHEVVVSAQQVLLLQSDAIFDVCGAPRALMNASEFFGRFGAFRVIPEGELSLTVLSCAKAVVLIGKEGVMYQCAGLDDDPVPTLRKSAASPYPRVIGRDGAYIVEREGTRFRPFDMFQCLEHNFELLDDVEGGKLEVIGG